jgi:hypothetical protein
MALITSILGAVSTGLGTVLSFSQAAEQRKKAAEAEASAAKFIQEAKKRFEVNYAKALSIQKDVYEQERRATRAAGAQVSEALKESERGAAAGAGKVLAMEQQAQADTSKRMGQELTDIDRAIIAEDIRAADALTQIQLDEGKGAGLAAREADERAALATLQGAQGMVDFVGAVGKVPKLFSDDDLATGEMIQKQQMKGAIPSTQQLEMNQALRSQAPRSVVDFFNPNPILERLNSPQISYDFQNPFMVLPSRIMDYNTIR